MSEELREQNLSETDLFVAWVALKCLNAAQGGETLDIPRIKDRLITLINRERAEAEKAYGGCHKCYGKGYSTQILGEEALGDFEGDKDYEVKPYPQMIFCTCDRGKQLKGFITSEKKQAVEKLKMEEKDLQEFLDHPEIYHDGRKVTNLSNTEHAKRFGYNQAVKEINSKLDEFIESELNGTK